MYFFFGKNIFSILTYVDIVIDYGIIKRKKMDTWKTKVLNSEFSFS